MFQFCPERSFLLFSPEVILEKDADNRAGKDKNQSIEIISPHIILQETTTHTCLQNDKMYHSVNYHLTPNLKMILTSGFGIGNSIRHVSQNNIFRCYTL